MQYAPTSCPAARRVDPAAAKKSVTIRPASGENEAYETCTRSTASSHVSYTRPATPAPCGRSGEPVDPEQLRLQPVVALGDVVAAMTASTSASTVSSGVSFERLRACEPVVVAAQPVVGRLVEQQRVEDVRARANPRREPLGDRRRRAWRRTSRSGSTAATAPPRATPPRRRRDTDGAQQLAVEPPPGAGPAGDFSLRIRSSGSGGGRGASAGASAGSGGSARRVRPRARRRPARPRLRPLEPEEEQLGLERASCSWMRWSSAPRAGSAVLVEKCRYAYARPA